MNDVSDTLTVQSTNMTPITNADVKLGWFISAFGREWMRIDLLDVDPGHEVEVCIIDTFDTYGTWLCIKDSVMPATLYSYGPEYWIEYYTSKTNSPVPGAGFKISISIAGK